MANYSYQSSNQPMSNQDQSYPNFDYNNQNFNNFPNSNQGDFQNNQWNPPANDYGQQVPNYQGYEQQSNNQQFNYPNQEGNFSSSSYNFNQQSSGKKEGYGNRQGSSNFRGAPGNSRNSGQGFNKGPRGNFGSSNVEEQHDTIFVSGLPEDTTESQLEAFFGSIGLIKIDKKTRRPRIWIYKNKETSKPKGEVTITYDDYMTASSAINWFNGKEFNGKILKVELAQRKNNFLSSNKGNFSGRSNSSRDFDKGSSHNERSSSGRDGDWVCPNPSCKNNNFAWRSSCNRCKTEKPDGDSSNHSSDRRSNNLPYERRGGPNSGGRGPMNNRDNGRNSYNNSRNRNGSQQGDRSFNRNNGGNRDQRGGGRNGNQSGGRPSGGGPMRSSDNRRSGPY